jgi:hypothetical protein
MVNNEVQMHFTSIYLFSDKKVWQPISGSHTQLEELQDTGENWKRWLKRYNHRGPQFA